ncbi:MAG: sialate O-acetylesterase [Rikenellaceae bacterium]|nr:sialate O-acetylesterase [Rikenellaceae bacterium]
MKKEFIYILLLISVSFFSCTKSGGENNTDQFTSNSVVDVSSSLKSNMVLQQKSDFTICGKGSSGEKIRVTCSWQSEPQIVTVEANSEWSVTVSTPQASMNPVTIKVEGKYVKEFTNILIGEVWICSGQSNMQWFLKNADNGATEVASATLPKVRLLNMTRKTATTPQESFDAEWLPCMPSTAGDFSAVGYFFGKALFQELGVPIGLIGANWGNTAIEVWMDSKWVENDSELNSDSQLRMTGHTDGSPYLPGSAYNAMIHPLKDIPVAGVIWYQGENNQGSPYIYPKFLKTMIEGWRGIWKRDFPVYICQIAPYQREWNYRTYYSNPAMRFSQAEATKIIPKTAIEVNDDIADISNIHPRNKKDVGARLASLALSQTYGKSSYNRLRCPIFNNFTINGNKVVINFSYAESGLKTTDGNAPTMFEICGSDKVFYTADTKISGSTVELTSQKVPIPVAARMGWSYTKITNLRNNENLPVSVFRTYQWEDASEEK